MTSSLPFQHAVHWFFLGGLRRNSQVLGFGDCYSNGRNGEDGHSGGRLELVRCVSWNGFSSEDIAVRDGTRAFAKSSVSPNTELGTFSGDTNFSRPLSTDDEQQPGDHRVVFKRCQPMGTLSQRDLEDYLQEKEYQDLLIKGNGESENGHVHDDQEEDDGPTPEEAVSDADWLRETGFEFLIKAFDDNECCEEEDPLKGVISTLTLAQAEAVLKRVDHVRAATIQKRKISKRLPDVRDVFPSIKEDAYQLDGPTSDPINCGPSVSKSTSNLDGDYNRDYYSEDVPCPLPFDHMVSDGAPNNGSDVKQKMGQLRQSSVDEVRRVFRSQSYENKADPRHKKGNWMDKNPFLRAAHKQGYKLGHTPPGSQVTGAGVKVLSYNIRSSMKHLKPNAATDKKLVTDLFAPTVEIDEEINFYDKNEDDYGFLISEGADSDCKDNVLPDVEITENPLGVTYPSDLGTEDQKKMHTLALIELAALLDQHGLTYSRRKAAKRKLKDGVFGVALTTLVEEDRQRFPRCQTPIIFQRLLEEMERRTLKEEGILRKTASMQSAESLKELVDSSYRTCPDLVEEAVAQASPHDLSFLTKSFIRELPEPLLTNAYLDAFLQVTEIPCIVEQLKALNLLVMLLSEMHRETLKRLLEFLEKVSEMEQYNRMNAQNLSVIMAPNLFPPARSGRTGHGQEIHKKDINQEMALATRTATITKMLLKYKQVLWTVPLPLLKQIREQNEELSKTRLGKEHKGLKLLQRKPKDDYSKPRSNSDSSGSERSASICSTSPLMESNNGNKSIAVQLECDRRRVFTVTLYGTLTVGSLLDKTLESAGGCGREKVNGRTRASSLENYYYSSIPSETNDFIPSLSTQCGHALYEVGGNIGQRKLDPNARIAILYKNNPDAEWMVKCGF